MRGTGKVPKSKKNRNEEECCYQCGKKGTDFEDWGDTVPLGQSGKFCRECFQKRQRYLAENNKYMTSQKLDCYVM